MPAAAAKAIANFMSLILQCLPAVPTIRRVMFRFPEQLQTRPGTIL
jgi:hypothetical protein